MSGVGEFYSAAERCLNAGEAIAVATIVRTRGSSPREVGARMLVRPDGATDGTVGGGCGEAEVFRTALDVLDRHRPQMVTVDLTEDIAMNTDGVCGGIMDIFVEAWLPTAYRNGSETNGRHAAEMPRIARALLEAADARRPAVIATVVGVGGPSPASLGAKQLLVGGEPREGELGWPWLEARVRADAAAVLEGGKSLTRAYRIEPAPDNGLTERVDVSLFYELVLPKPRLVIVGAGHVALPLARVGKLLDFEVTVIDDRPMFANASRFPDAAEVVVDDFEAALDRVEMTPSTYVVLVTRGHVHDVRSLRKIIHQPAGYIGMIGSRRRVFAVFKLLRDEGVPLDALMRVHAPIGLDIKTETPGEIAVSVGAELLKVRRGGGAASFSDLLRPQYLYSLSKGAQDLE